MGLTQSELGAIFGVKGQQIRLWEKGDSFPQQSRLKEIYKYFGWNIPESAMIGEMIPLEVKVCPACGDEFPIYKKRTIFCSISCANKAENNPAWKGGEYKIRGYVKVKAPGHPHADTASYMLEHRLVIEEDIGRYLEPHERVHHKNGIRNDNRLENLELWKVKGHKDPAGVRAADYHCPGCICSQNPDSAINKILALSKTEGLTESSLRAILTTEAEGIIQ